MASNRFLLLGLPGAGKGTQGARLARYFNVPEIGSGDLVRDHIARGTEFGKKVQAAAAAGNLVPDEDILYWMGERLKEPDAAEGYVLDGFPRDLKQAVAFDRMLDDNGAGLKVVELHLPEAAVVARLSGREVCPKCGRVYHETMHAPRVSGLCDLDDAELIRRADDTPAAIRHRIKVYDHETEPLIGYYCASGRLVTVNADAGEDAVFSRILSAVYTRRHVQ